MKIRLFANESPHGRCLILAQKLNQATTLPPTECVALAERLFALAYKRENPAVVEVTVPIFAEDLAATCAEFRISVEGVLHEDTPSMP